MYLETQAEVEQRVERGEHLNRVDRYVLSTSLSDQEKEELMLWAWAWRETDSTSPTVRRAKLFMSNLEAYMAKQGPGMKSRRIANSRFPRKATGTPKASPKPTGARARRPQIGSTLTDRLSGNLRNRRTGA